MNNSRTLSRWCYNFKNGKRQIDQCKSISSLKPVLGPALDLISAQLTKRNFIQIVSIACLTFHCSLLVLLLLLTPLVLLVEVGVDLHRLPHGVGHAVHLFTPQRPPNFLSLFSEKSESRKAKSGSDVVSYSPSRRLNPLKDDILTKRW